jgi:hypothetical protein
VISRTPLRNLHVRNYDVEKQRAKEMGRAQRSDSKNGTQRVLSNPPN